MKLTALVSLLPLLVSFSLAAPTEPLAAQVGPAIHYPFQPDLVGDVLHVSTHSYEKRLYRETYYVDLFDKNYMWVLIEDDKNGTTAVTTRWEHRAMLAQGGPSFSSAAPKSSAASGSASVSRSAISTANSSVGTPRPSSASSKPAVAAPSSSAPKSSASSSAPKASASSSAPKSSASASASKPAAAASSSAPKSSASSSAPKSSASASASKPAAAASSSAPKSSASASAVKPASSSASAPKSSAPVSSSKPAAAASSSAPKSSAPVSSSKPAVAASSSAPKSSASASASKPAAVASSTAPKSSASASKAAASSASAAAPKSSSSSAAPKPSSSATAPAAASGSASASAGVSAADQAKFLTLHNDFRAKYSANPVVWDQTLADYALKTAQSCKYGHTGGPYGENIAAGVGGGYNIDKAFSSWANEDALYDFNKPGYASATGHFTAIVWKGTTKVGCAAASCADGSIFTGYRANSTYVVCNYQTPGNIVSSDPARTAEIFRSNVGPKK